MLDAADQQVAYSVLINRIVLYWSKDICKEDREVLPNVDKGREGYKAGLFF